MTTKRKRNPDTKQYRKLEKFYKTKWSKQLVSTYKTAQKFVGNKKLSRLLFSEIEIHGDENESKKETVEKKSILS